jgi:hypothetical protein
MGGDKGLMVLIRSKKQVVSGELDGCGVTSAEDGSLGLARW